MTTTLNRGTAPVTHNGMDMAAGSHALHTRAPDPYPLLIRMGHSFETVVGQRLIVDGFYGALDVAIGGDDWYYVLNKMVAGPLYPRVRYAVCNLKDEFPRNIFPMIDGKPEVPGSEVFKSPVCCDSDRKGTLFFTDEHADRVAIISTAGETLGWWGQSGDGPGQLKSPSGIVYAPDGTLWVVNTLNNRVQNFTREGRFIRGFAPGKGAAPGQLDHPWGIGVDPVNNTVLIADWRNDRVQRFSPSGQHLQTIDTLGRDLGGMKRPSGVAIDAHGDIYICDRGNDRVLQFNPRGLFIESFLGDAWMTERGADKLMANPDMCRWRDHIVDMDREKRFWKPSAVRVDDQFRVFVIDAGRYRMQVYRKRFRVLQPTQAEAAETYTSPKVN
jgi:DNA-binding beta-propeller fold protein YncE